MPSFDPGPGPQSLPVGKNEYRRSTKGLKYDYGTFAKGSLPGVVDEVTGVTEKVLQSGAVLAKITSGADSGKLGVFSLDTAGVTDGRSDVANIVGVNDTYDTFRLRRRDIEVAYCYEGALIQPNVLVLDATGKYVSAPDNVAAALVGKKSIDIKFR